MSQYGIHDFINEANKQIKFYEQQQHRMQDLLRDYERKIGDLTSRSQEVLRQITNALVPEFTEMRLKHIAQLINNPALNNLIKNKEKERKSLSETIHSIEAMPEFINRDAYLHEGSGVISQQIAEIEPLREQAEEAIRLFESVPRYKGLLERGYGTSSYPHKSIFRFFNSEFLQDWKYADILCDFFREKDFINVLFKYKEAKNVITLLKDSTTELQNQKRRIDSLVEQHSKAEKKLDRLDDEYEGHLRTSIELFFTSNSKSTISRTFQNNSAILEQYTQLDGLNHQLEYVRELHKKVMEEVNVISEKIHSLSLEAERYRADSYRYRNKRWDSTQFSKKFKRDENSYNRRLEKYRNTGERIYVFNDYGRASMLENFLWWDIITDGRLDGNFIPEVHDYYSSNPHSSYEREESASEYRDES